MAPRICTSQPDNGEADLAGDKVTITEAAIEDTEDGAEMIPFRTSKRLQGAIFRMIQERDGGYNNNNMSRRDRHSSTVLSSRLLKRQHSPPEEIDSKDGGIVEDSTRNRSFLKEASCQKRRKNSNVRFADPLFVYIDQKETVYSTKLRSEFRQARKVHETDEAAVPSSPVGHQFKQPLSCFDLLCNHVGPRGWRCYRSSIQGKSFCNYHQGRTDTSFDNGISRIVCT